MHNNIWMILVIAKELKKNTSGANANLHYRFRFLAIKPAVALHFTDQFLVLDVNLILVGSMEKVEMTIFLKGSINEMANSLEVSCYFSWISSFH